MNNDTKLFVLGLTSSFVAGLVLVYLYSKWNQKEITPLSPSYRLKVGDNYDRQYE